MRQIEKTFLWYQNTLLPVLEREFPLELPKIAIGVAGRGSECFGFDDELSADHDVDPGVSLWLTDEDERSFGFRLEKVYRNVLKTSFPDRDSAGSKLGDSERKVDTVSSFFMRHLGIPGVPQTLEQWLYIPAHAFAETINGRVFRDDSGVFSRIRAEIASGMPEDVRKKKIAARAVLMAQSGQYNFLRCARRGEHGAAAMALGEFVKNAIPLIFLLNRQFEPYYKWQFRALRQLPVLSEMADPLEFLLTCESTPQNKAEMVDEIAGCIVRELNKQNLSARSEVYLEGHAFEIMRSIRSAKLRSMHIMEG